MSHYCIVILILNESTWIKLKDKFVDIESTSWKREPIRKEKIDYNLIPGYSYSLSSSRYSTLINKLE